MTSLVSDETLGKVVRLVWERPILCADRTAIMTHVLEDQWATALDVAREMLTPEDDAIAALEEANEEAAVTYDDREAKLDADRAADDAMEEGAMSDPRLTRVQAAMTALRPARCVTMARIDEFLARNKVAEAINEADGMRQREPFVHLVNELVDALRALEEANEEAARTHDEREAKLDAVCRTKLYRGEWIAPGAVPGLARAMADTIRATVAAHETQLDAVTADVKAAAPPGIEVERVADGFRLTGQARRVMTAHNPSNPQPPAEWPLPRGASPWLNPDQPPLPRMAWTIAGHTYSTAAGHDAFTELRRKVEAGEWDEPLPDTTRIDATAKHPIPHLDDAPEPPKRQEHDPSRRWACPKCTSVLAVERIFEIVAGRGERYAHVVRCLCGEVRP